MNAEIIIATQPIGLMIDMFLIVFVYGKNEQVDRKLDYVYNFFLAAYAIIGLQLWVEYAIFVLFFWLLIMPVKKEDFKLIIPCIIIGIIIKLITGGLT